METGSKVVVTDFDIPFGNLVLLMVKFAIAAIPAAIILSVLGFFIVLLAMSAAVVVGDASASNMAAVVGT
jgi:hypothetical protein